MLDLLLIAYLVAVLGTAYATIKHYGLWIKSPAEQLEEKRTLTEEIMRILNGMSCPFCGSRDTYVERVDLWKANSAIQTCNSCNQKVLWKLENHVWHLIAPYRYALTIPKVPASAPAEKMKESEIELVFD